MSRWFKEREPPKWFEAWEWVAGRYRGSAVFDRGFTEVDDKVILTVLVKGVTVRGQMYANRDVYAHRCELEAPVPAAGPFVLDIYPAGGAIRAAARKALRIPDVEVGDPRFDDEYVVQSNDIVLARHWVSADIITALRAVGDIKLALRDRKLEADVAGPLADAARLEAAVRAVARFARGAEPIRDEWTAAATVLGATPRARWTIDGGAPIELTVGGARVIVDARWAGGHVHTVATTPSQSAARKLVEGDVTVDVGPDETMVFIRGVETRPEALHRLAVRAADAAVGRDGPPTNDGPYR